jgi:two-component system NtrC family sensor kinase
MKLSLATRIFLGYAVVLVTFGAVSIFAVAEMHRNQGDIRLVSQGYLHLSQDSAALDTFHKNQEKDNERLFEEKSLETRRALIRLSRLYFPPLIEQRLEGARQKSREILDFAPDSEALFVRDVEQRFAELSTRYDAYHRTAEVIFTELESPLQDATALGQRMSELKGLQVGIGREIRVLHASLENRIRERVAQAERRERTTGIAIIALSVLAIGVGLIATALSARSLRPVRTLIEGVSRIGRGDYSAHLGVRGEDEIALLAREFNAMARSLQEREAQLKEKQEALLRAEQLAAVGRITAQVAHEVRNPLSSIGLNVELLDDALSKAQYPSQTQSQEVKQLLSSVHREIDRLTEITENYLKMARVPNPTLAKESINDVLTEVLDFSREELERSRVQVLRELDPSRPKTLADESQLKQVFLNLLRNSREAMSQGGQLKVMSQTRNGHVEVVFSDSGKGMKDDVQRRIFEPFFSTKKGGSGLGLSVSRQILQAHGGTIECESREGQGTTFTVRLPRAPEGF